MEKIKKQKLVFVDYRSNFCDMASIDWIARVTGEIKQKYGDLVDVEFNLLEAGCWIGHKKSESPYSTSPSRRMIELALDKGVIGSIVGYCGYARGMFEDCYHPALLNHENFRFYKKMKDAVGAYTTGDKMLFF
jgi:hypothetical protein